MKRVVPDKPGPGQESVWDYPRPPRLEHRPHRVEVRLGGATIAQCDGVYVVLETSHPPTYYLPPGAFVDGALRPTSGSSHCEWKGVAQYWDLLGGDQVAERAGWSYPQPTPTFAPIRDHVALYAAAMDGCYVDGERVRPQPGGFYGGWVTDRVVGPFKGEPGTWGW